MPRPSQSLKDFADDDRKIRKRGCLSTSSSSSSVLQNYRLKRAVFVSKSCGRSTPVPAWKVAEHSRGSTADVSEFSQLHYSRSSSGGPVSARKLANALWELSEMPSPLVGEKLQERRSKNEASRRSSTTKSKSGSIPRCLSDPSQSPVSEVMGPSGSSCHRTKLMPLFYQKPRFSEVSNRCLDSPCTGSLVEVELQSRGCTFSPTSPLGKSKSCLKKLCHCLRTSKELLKILAHAVGREKHTSSSMPIFQVLRHELEKTHGLVDQLMEEERLDVHGGFQHSKRQIDRSWKEKEGTWLAIQSILEELELEKKFRRETERVNTKLHLKLSDIKSVLSKANKELEKERRSRELIEHVCGELANRIRDNKVEVEEMKREAAEVREELEKEREMLQLAEVWREERVQMKLSEAKFHLEEKNAAVDQLRNELEVYLASKRSMENSLGNRNGINEVDAENLCKRWVTDMKADHSKGGKGGRDRAADDGEVDSVDSDLHPIELNMDSHNKSYRWSFNIGDAVPTSLDEDNNRTTTIIHENTSMSNDLLRRSTSVGSQQNSFGKNFQDSWIVSETEEHRNDNNDTIADKQSRKLDPDAERYKSVKRLRDKMLSSSKVKRGLSSPKRPWVRQQAQAGSGEKVHAGSKVSKVPDAMVDVEANAQMDGENGGSHVYGFEQKDAFADEYG